MPDENKRNEKTEAGTPTNLCVCERYGGFSLDLSELLDVSTKVCFISI